MHNAPPVAYPVGRFVWGHALLVGTLVLSAAGLLTWQWLSQSTSAMVWSAWAFWLVCASATAYGAPKQTLSDGFLLWSGETWWWQSGLGGAEHADEVDGEDGGEGDGEGWTLSVGLDLGSCMVLMVQRPPDGHRGRGHWRCAWVSEQAMPSKWHGFRCAVYSRQKALKPSPEHRP